MGKRTPWWMEGVKEREKEREREAKAKTVYGVFEWSGGSQGGYVVRTGERLPDNRLYFAQPYQDKTPVRVYTNQKAAQKHADKLNGYS